MFKKHRRFYQAQWAFLRVFCALFSLLVIAFAISELFQALSGSKALDSEILGMAGVMLLAAFIITWMARHWFNFLAGEEICYWRRPK